MSSPRARIWFLDTSSLLSMAVDEAVAAEVHAELVGDVVVLIDVVVDELQHRAAVPGTATLAETALAERLPDWKNMDTTMVTLEAILDAQNDVADGRTLTDERQHWAEATIIALARHSAALGADAPKVLLSEDYDARRVAAQVPHTDAMSIHGLLRRRVRASLTSAAAAAHLAEKLHDAGRGPIVSAEEFDNPSPRGLGRVGRP